MPLANGQHGSTSCLQSLVRGSAAAYCILTLQEGVEYLAEPVYKQLAAWYGVKDSLEFPRGVLELPDGSTRVDAFPQFCIVRSTAAEAAAKSAHVLIPRSVSASAILDTILGNAAAREALALTAATARSSVRLWMRAVEEQPQGVEAAAGDPIVDDTNPAAVPSSHVLVVEPTKMEDIARNALTSELLVELRNEDGSWPRGVVEAGADAGDDEASEPGDEHDTVWRAGLKKGSCLDAQDQQRAWLEARVLEVIPAPGDAMRDKLKVRFLGWSAKWDAYFLRESLQLARPYTFASPWRRGVRPGDAVEVMVNEAEPGAPWFQGWVLSMDWARLPPTLRIVVPLPPSGERIVELPLDADSIAKPLTHLKGTTVEPFSWLVQQPPKQSKVQPYTEAAAAAADGGGGASSTPAGPDSSALVAVSGVTDLSTRRTTRSGWAKSSILGGRTREEDDEDGEDDGGPPAANGAAGPEDQRAVATRARRYYTEAVGGTAYSYGGHRRAPGTMPGVCGLENLGNTCFMNSVLQCLSNTELLARYFVSDEYINEINVHNVLGSKGHLAHAYAALVHAMWSGEFSKVSPGPVKQHVAKKAPAFMGFGQQDSQEFMNFLLDGLLEDLCRVHPKPPVPGVESAGRPDAIVAEEAWRGYLRRNDSRIVDIFGGQYRSDVQCNQCGRQSITFDPFTTVSVPIPTEKWVPRDVYYFNDPADRPMKFVYWYNSSQAITAGDIAKYVYTQLRASNAMDAVDGDEEVGGAGAGAGGGGAAAPSASGPAAAGAGSAAAPAAPAGPPDAKYPLHPGELLVTITTGNPGCHIRLIVPHYATVQEALREAGRENAIMIYHVAGGGQQLAAGAGGADSAAPGSASAAADVVGASAEREWDFSWHGGGAPTALGGDDDDDYDFMARYRDASRAASSASAAAKPKPAAPARVNTGPAGPRPHEFVTVWLRFEPGISSEARRQFYSAGDALVVSLRSYGCNRANRKLTNRQVHEEVWRKLKRFLPDEMTTSGAAGAKTAFYQLKVLMVPKGALPRFMLSSTRVGQLWCIVRRRSLGLRLFNSDVPRLATLEPRTLRRNGGPLQRQPCARWATSSCAGTRTWCCRSMTSRSRTGRRYNSSST